jgi:hypothetical protein
VSWTLGQAKFRRMAAGALYDRLVSIDSLDITHATQSFEKSRNAVRKGWPAYVDSPLAWKGREFLSESQYTYSKSRNRCQSEHSMISCWPHNFYALALLWLAVF